MSKGYPKEAQQLYARAYLAELKEKPFLSLINWADSHGVPKSSLQDWISKERLGTWNFVKSKPDMVLRRIMVQEWLVYKAAHPDALQYKWARSKGISEGLLAKDIKRFKDEL